MPEALYPLWNGWVRSPRDVILSDKWRGAIWRADSLSLPPGFTFARTGAALQLWGASYASALYENVTQDVPRFERLSDGSVGLRIDGAETNSTTYSNPDTTSRFGGAQAENTVENISWGGVFTKAVRSAAAISSVSFAYSSATATVGQPCGFSILARRLDGAPVVVGGVNTSADATIDFVLNCGGTGSGLTITNQALGNGIHLITAYKAVAGGTSLGGAKYPGNRAGQIEWTGLSVAANLRWIGSPVLTNGSAATRNAETLYRSVVGENLMQGTVFIDAEILSVAAGSRWIHSLTGTNAANDRIIIYNNGGAIYSLVSNGGASVAITLTNTVVPGRHKIAIAWTASRLAGSLNGGAVLAAVLSGLPTFINESLGNQLGLSQLFGNIRAYARWPYMMSDAQIQALTL